MEENGGDESAENRSFITESRYLTVLGVAGDRYSLSSRYISKFLPDTRRERARYRGSEIEKERMAWATLKERRR